MGDGSRNINDLFALAKKAEVNYSIKNVTNVINSAAATGAVAGASSIFKLSNIVIMVGSILTVATIAVVLSGPTESVLTETQEPMAPMEFVQKNGVAPVIIKEQPIIQAEDGIPIVDEVWEPELIEKVNIPIVFDDADSDDVEPALVIVPEVITDGAEHEICESTCNNQAAAGEGIKLEAFHSIELNVGVDIEIVKGDAPMVSINKDPLLLKMFIFDVDDGILNISLNKDKKKEYKKYGYNNDLTLIVSMSELKSIYINGGGDIHADAAIKSTDLFIEINGSGDVALHQIVPTNFEISINGSGDVSLYGEGSAANGEINISGSGDVCTKSINASEMEVNIIGSGDVKLTCKDNLTVSITGSGDVCYDGSATLDVKKVGSGDVYNCSN